MEDIQSKNIEENADRDAELDDLIILNGLRKSMRQRREPTWLKDFSRGKKR